jgi:hypothetical protein
MGFLVDWKGVDYTVRNTALISFYDIRDAENAYALFTQQRFLTTYVDMPDDDTVKITTQQFYCDQPLQTLLESYGPVSSIQMRATSSGCSNGNQVEIKYFNTQVADAVRKELATRPRTSLPAPTPLKESNKAVE